MASKLKKCKVCENEIAVSAKRCPHCGAKNPKPIYKKWWLWVILIIVFIIIISDNSNSSVRKQNQEIQSEEKIDEKEKKCVTRDNYDKIQNGMTEEQVEEILGEPSMLSENELAGYGKTILKHYQERFSTKAIDVYFQNGKVVMKNWAEL